MTQGQMPPIRGKNWRPDSSLDFVNSLPADAAKSEFGGSIWHTLVANLPFRATPGRFGIATNFEIRNLRFQGGGVLSFIPADVLCVSFTIWTQK